MTVAVLVMTLNFDPLTSKCKGKIQNWCTVTVPPTIEHHGGHSRTPATQQRWDQNVKVTYILSPSCIYIWNLYIENYLNYCVRTKVLTKFRCDLDLWLFYPKCIGIFLSPSCIFVWYMKAVRGKLLGLLCQNQSVDKVQLWHWPLTV